MHIVVCAHLYAEYTVVLDFVLQNDKNILPAKTYIINEEAVLKPISTVHDHFEAFELVLI